jgi:spermidine synthase
MRRLFFATFFVSAAAIGYEILLMRVLSIVQWHHFAYMIISLALLGYGASGTFIALFRRTLEPHFEAAFALCALLFSVTMVACFVVGQRVPFNALEIIWDRTQFANLSLLYLVFFVPFFFAACCIGLAFTCRNQAINRIYFFDLLGAGAGAMLVIGLLFVTYPQAALLVLVVLALVASRLAGAGETTGWPLMLGQFAWLLVVAVIAYGGGLSLRPSEFKGLSQALQVIDSQVLAAASSPLGLLTIVDSPTVPIRHAPGLSFNARDIPPEQLAVFTDAAGMSAITRYDGNPESIAYLADITAALPYTLLDEPDVLLLGAGGGDGVLMALYHDAGRIDAVELNPQMSAFVADTYADFAGHIYDDPRVAVHTAEARGFVARNDRRYDLIQIGLLDSFAAAGSGVQALNESYLYTVEALREYLGDLRPGGLLAITRWIKSPPRDNLKLIATAIEALVQSGVDPAKRLVVIRSWNTVTLLVGNGEFSANDIDRIRKFASSRSFDTAYFPGIDVADTNRFNLLDEPWLYDGIHAMLGDKADAWFASYKYFVEPATDDRPYFSHFFKWETLPEVLSLRTAGGAGLIEWAYLIVVATLVQAVVVGCLLILLPLSWVRRTWSGGLRYGSYFLLLGLAFLFVEIAFIQKFTLFLGHPLYAIAVVLASFLVFAGAGSAYSARIARKSGIAVAGIVGIAIIYMLVLPLLFGWLIGMADSLRILLSVVLIAPLAFFMGMPFPLGLRRLAEEAPDFVPWAWGINGFASVVSAVLATLLAIHFGFTVVIALALLLYVAAASLRVA